MDNKAVYKALNSKNNNKIIEAFDTIYQEYYKLIYFVISKYINNEQDIEDLTNDVFLNFFEQVQKTKINNIKYYLVSSAKNRSLNFLSRQNEQIPYDDDIFMNVTEKSNVDYCYDDLIKEMSNVMTEEEIKIVLMHCIDDMKFKEISKELNKPLNTTISIYHRALKKFRKHIGE